MYIKAQSRSSIFGMSWKPANTTLAVTLTLMFLIFMIVFLTVTAQQVQAQTFTVIHTFTGGTDGFFPDAGVTLVGHTLFGTAFGGGAAGQGTVYKMRSTNGNWTFAPLHAFGGSGDGAQPVAPVVIGRNGSLYGTTQVGGSGPHGYGTVFSLTPSPTPAETLLNAWEETVLYSFQGQGLGAIEPGWGALAADQAGNLYGTTRGGGMLGYGTVFELSPSQEGWTEKILYNFRGNNDGVQPIASVVFDNAGNLYGTTCGGGAYGLGTVYELTPSGYGWVESVLYAFTGGSDGTSPWGGVIVDQSGNLYGTTNSGGMGRGGTVFELSPSAGGWVLTTLHSFSYNGSSPWPGSYASLAIDQAGNLYGTTSLDGTNFAGNVFKLTPGNGGWTYSSLHDFTGGSDGWDPVGSVTLDASGAVYGTAAQGGTYGDGVVFEIRP